MLIAIMMLAYSLPICLAVGFYFGRKSNDKVEDKPAKMPIFARNKKEVKRETEDQKRQRILAENIENFGTEIPQQEV